MRFIFFFSFAFLCAACAATDDRPREDTSLDQEHEQALDKIDVEACKAGGGGVRRAGLLGLPRCITPYVDAGKTCTSGEQCQGRCMAADEITDFHAPPGKAEGICEADDSPFGCYATLNKGTLSSFLCVD